MNIVDEKIKGYCREDTINYYKSIVEKAWEQVEATKTPELASKLFNENLLWLMLDERYAERTREKFTPIVFIPTPDWWWLYHTRYLHHPQETSVPSVPGAEFVNSVATALESTSLKIVSDIEKFMNNILPSPPAKKNHRSLCITSLTVFAPVPLAERITLSLLNKI
ncbi:MAG: hypothetical protein ACUVTL_08220 [Thermoproteota archaeon]